MIFNALRTNILLLLVSCLLGISLLSCNKDDEPAVIPEENIQRVILIYAVNHSSLKFDFKSDSIEITKAMQNVDLSRHQVLIYKTIDRENTALYKFAPDEKGIKVFSEVKAYPRNVTSTDSDRIKGVIQDALSIYPDAVYDLIFWGHGTAWVPGNDDNSVYESKGPERAYGGEYNGNTTGGGSPITSWTNLDNLVNAVPDHRFEYIWFDCCYMSGIEVLYQFRNKCNTFVGYPTEVLSGGMAYDLVLPYLVKDTPDLEGGARAFFNAYDQKNQPVTVAVIDMSKLKPVVEAAKAIIAEGFQVPPIGDMVNYSRMSSTMLVDFVTYFSAIALENGRQDLADNLRKAFDDMRIYAAASSKDFRDRNWDLAKINCVSSFFLDYSENDNVRYYKTLDWYKEVF